MITLKQMAENAKKLGELHFDCGRDCGKCGTRIRYVSGFGQCVQCKKDHFLSWKLRNLEHYLLVQKKWVKLNRHHLKNYNEARKQLKREGDAA
jgi:hypothetical protein